MAGKSSSEVYTELGEQLRRLPESWVTQGASVARGSTSDGDLLQSLGLPRDSQTLRVLKASRRRALNYGHSRLVNALERIASSFADAQGQALWLGNMAAKDGGRIRFSRSHQTGLDVDIVIPVMPIDGKGVSPAIRSVRASTEPVDSRPLMDVAATWTLVQELLLEPDVDMLWIFLSDPLIDALIDYAVISGAPERLVNIAAHVLHQPSDSLPHDDHFHIRAACHPADLIAGCRDSRPLWPWARKSYRPVDELILGDLLAALEGRRDLGSALKAVIRTRTRAALPYAFVLMGDEDPALAALAARAVDALDRSHLILAGHSQILEKPHLAAVERRALERCLGHLCSGRAAELLERSRGCKEGSASEHRSWTKAMIRNPRESATDSLFQCLGRVRKGDRPLLMEALARIAGSSLPKEGGIIAARTLVAKINARPGRRFERLWDSYLGPDSWAHQDLLRLHGRIGADGVDAMNRRELLEAIWAFPRKSNWMSRRRRVRIWKNRVAALNQLIGSEQTSVGGKN